MIKIDWPRVWWEYDTRNDILGSNRELIEQLVNAQIEAQETVYPELCDPPPPGAIMANEVIRAAKKAANSGSVKDLHDYMNLRRKYS